MGEVVLDGNRLNEMEKALDLASYTIYKNYLQDLEQYEVVPLCDLAPEISFQNPQDNIRLLQLKKLSYEKNEDVLQKLATIYNAVTSQNVNLIIIIDSVHNKNSEFYIGICGRTIELGKPIETLKVGLDGNFTGTEYLQLGSDEKSKKLFDSIFCIDEDIEFNIASVSCSASLRDKVKTQRKDFIQGIEKFIDAMQGKIYTAMFIAEPVSIQHLLRCQDAYESLYTNFSQFEKTILQYNKSDSQALMESITTGVSKSTSDTTGTNTSKSNAHTKGNFESNTLGVNFGTNSSTSKGDTKSITGTVTAGFGIPNIAQIGASLAVGVTKSVVNTIGAQMGMSYSKTKGISTSDTETETTGESKSHSDTTTDNESKSNSNTNTSSIGESIQFESKNKSIENILKNIDVQLQKLEKGKTYGLYKYAGYFMSTRKDNVILAANTYRALMLGDESSMEISSVNIWNTKEQVDAMKQYLIRGKHPVFSKEQQVIHYDPSILINGLDLPIHMSLPMKSIQGLPVVEHVRFGRNVKKSDGENIEIGKHYHMGKEENGRVPLELQSIAAHMLITGSTGSGKSNTIYKILSELHEKNVKFMVIEPAKGEYKHIFGNATNVNVFGTNSKVSELLKINPFKFPEKIHVLEHIDRLIEIFNVCWPMYAAMPAVLKEAVEKAYELCGWNLATSENETGKLFYPTFSDVCETLGQVIEYSEYSNELKSNYKGSLLTRVKSLTNGLNGQMFSGKEIDNTELFEKNVIIDLSRIGSMETKAMIMGILVMRLSEYRMAKGGINSLLEHVTVLEEAHHLLRRTSTEQNSEGNNLIGKSVEMLTNAIAEMRTYGEGFIIAEQSPGLLDLAVIRNTNTKVVLRMPEHSDRILVGKSACMTDEQVDELSKLESGVAAVYQSNWLEPVLCKVDYYKTNEEMFSYVPKMERVSVKKYRSEIVKLLLKGRVQEDTAVNIDLIEREIEHIELSTRSKMQLYKLIDEYKANNKLCIWENKNFPILAKLITNLLESRDRIDYEVNQLNDIKQFKEVIIPILDYKLEDIPSYMIDEVIHCVVKEISNNSEEHLKLYYLWYKEIRNDLV